MSGNISSHPSSSLLRKYSAAPSVSWGPRSGDEAMMSVTGESGPSWDRAADTVWCNEALADLTNSSLIQNSSHRQFHIISRSRTLLQPPSHCCNSDCSRRVQPRFFLSNFYKNMESWSQKGHWGVRRRGENCGHNNRTSILGVIQTIRCNWLRLDWKSQISHKFPFYLLHLPQNWGNSHISRSVSVGAYKKLPHRPKVLDPALLRCFIYFVSSFARARTSRVFASTGQHAVTPRSRMKPLNATDQSLISPLLLDKIDEFVCPLFEDLWSKVLPEEMIFVFHRWLGAGAGPVPVTQRSLMMSLYLFSNFIIFLLSKETVKNDVISVDTPLNRFRKHRATSPSSIMLILSRILWNNSVQVL